MKGWSLWRTDVVSGNWIDEITLKFGSLIIPAYGVTSVNGDLELFVGAIEQSPYQRTDE